jgi:hypothetical protein
VPHLRIALAQILGKNVSLSRINAPDILPAKDQTDSAYQHVLEAFNQLRIPEERGTKSAQMARDSNHHLRKTHVKLCGDANPFQDQPVFEETSGVAWRRRRP